MWNKNVLFFFVVKGPAADATDAPQQLCEEDDYFSIVSCNGAPVEWNWQGKTEVLGEKPVPVSLCPPQIPHGLTRDQIRATAVRGRRLTAWAMARTIYTLNNWKNLYLNEIQNLG
jgi:hypothetical protein